MIEPNLLATNSSLKRELTGDHVSPASPAPTDVTASEGDLIVSPQGEADGPQPADLQSADTSRPTEVSSACEGIDTDATGNCIEAASVTAAAVNQQLVEPEKAKVDPVAEAPPTAVTSAREPEPKSSVKESEEVAVAQGVTEESETQPPPPLQSESTPETDCVGTESEPLAPPYDAAANKFAGTSNSGEAPIVVGQVKGVVDIEVKGTLAEETVPQKMEVECGTDAVGSKGGEPVKFSNAASAPAPVGVVSASGLSANSLRQDVADTAVDALNDTKTLTPTDEPKSSHPTRTRVGGATFDRQSEPDQEMDVEEGANVDRAALQHSVSAVTKNKDSSKPRRRKRKPTEFVKTPAPSNADASAFREADIPERPAVFEAQPRIIKAADVSYKGECPSSARGASPSTFEKPAAPSCADVSFKTELTSSQKKAVFSSHASPSMADVNYASPALNKCTTSLFVSPPKESTADTGANAAAITSGSSIHKSIYESEAKPSLAAVRASDPVPQSAPGPALFTKPPAETKAHARAGVDLARDTAQAASVFESAPRDVAVAAKWCDPVVPKSSGSVFESKAVPSRADAAADRSLDSDDEYETDTDEE